MNFFVKASKSAWLTSTLVSLIHTVFSFRKFKLNTTIDQWLKNISTIRQRKKNHTHTHTHT
jgi:hypothetical protein